MLANKITNTNIRREPKYLAWKIKLLNIKSTGVTLLERMEEVRFPQIALNYKLRGQRSMRRPMKIRFTKQAMQPNQ